MKTDYRKTRNGHRPSERGDNRLGMSASGRGRVGVSVWAAGPISGVRRRAAESCSRPKALCRGPAIVLGQTLLQGRALTGGELVAA
jgi:hypothetical protein